MTDANSAFLSSSVQGSNATLPHMPMMLATSGYSSAARFAMRRLLADCGEGPCPPAWGQLQDRPLISSLLHAELTLAGIYVHLNYQD